MHQVAHEDTRCGPTWSAGEGGGGDKIKEGVRSSNFSESASEQEIKHLVNRHSRLAHTPALFNVCSGPIERTGFELPGESPETSYLGSDLTVDCPHPSTPLCPLLYKTPTREETDSASQSQSLQRPKPHQDVGRVFRPEV